jgi:NAD(P)-dependent dehydrogenase (short-subunit alcohol dehydrogenase family)
VTAGGAALIVGAGDGIGRSCAHAFAAQGLTACVTRRARHAGQLDALVAEIEAAGDKARGFGCDARDEDETATLFETIEREVGPLEVMVFNIGANVRFGIRETTAQVYRKVWEMAAFAGFLAAREAARHMVPRGRGTVIFTGATASLRGGAGFSAFAGAKHALRALAKSMARELGPQGIHVAHVVIDGAVDGAFIRGQYPDWEARLAQDALLTPDHIAAEYVRLWRQPRNAWTHELDLRPWKETF